MKKKLFAAVLAAAALFILSSASFAADVRAKDFKLQDLQGKTVTLSSFKGKIVVLNFWASWCPPCVREMPHIDALYQKYGDQINFAAVTIDENTGDAQAYLAKSGVSVPVYTGNINGIAADYGLEAIPVSVLIAADGTVLAQTVGGMDASALEAFLAPAL